MLTKLGQPQNYASKRISSYDRTGGNKDSLTIKAGETAILADIKGAGAIHHLWVTISAEPFYGRKLVLKMFWDGEKAPSVEVPIGDFFGVGHGLDRNFSSIPIACSSEGRAKNCYWYMPFKQSALVTVTNEGTLDVPAFYYYVDYRELNDLPGHALFPCPIPAGDAVRVRDKLRHPRRRGPRPLRRLQHERPPASHGLVG